VSGDYSVGPSKNSLFNSKYGLHIGTANQHSKETNNSKKPNTTAVDLTAGSNGHTSSEAEVSSDDGNGNMHTSSSSPIHDTADDVSPFTRKNKKQNNNNNTSQDNTEDNTTNNNTKKRKNASNNTTHYTKNVLIATHTTRFSHTPLQPGPAPPRTSQVGTIKFYLDKEKKIVRLEVLSSEVVTRK
jgi:hypothetical protein